MADNTLRAEAAAAHAASAFLPSPTAIPGASRNCSRGAQLGRAKRRARRAAATLDAMIAERFVEERYAEVVRRLPPLGAHGVTGRKRYAIRSRVVAAGTVLAGPMDDLPS